MATGAVSEIVLLDAIALSDLIRTRQVSAVEVMAAYLDHIDRFNPQVNAIISMPPRERLLAEAAESDEQLARGDYLGWMHGLPQAVKDNLPVRGLPFTRGSPLFRDYVAPADAIAVERMRAAGAIMIGKTNTPEFALGCQTHNRVFGTTLNPYDPTRTAGGSSGGAGAAVALRMLPLAIGTDHTGSLRNPAAFNNLFALRPGHGRVPVEATDPFTLWMSQIGPMARTVPDLARLLGLVSGHDPRVPLSLRDDPAPLSAPLTGEVTGKRIAWGGDLLARILPFEPGLLELCRAAVARFTELGAVVEEAVPDFSTEQLIASWQKLRASQVGAALLDIARDPARRAQLSEEALFELEGFERLSLADLAIAANVRGAWYQAVRRFFERYDYFVLPSAQVFPFGARTHWPREIAGRTMDSYYQWMEAMIPVTMAGCPTIGVPAGFNAAGLPMGLQIMARNHGERDCLELAYAYDQATGWVGRCPPPMLA